MHTSLIETYRIIYRVYRIDTAPVWYQEEILGRRSTVSGNVLTYVASAMLASALEVERLEEAEDTATLEEDHPLFSLLSQRSQGGYHDAPLAPASQSEPQQPFTIHTNLTYSQRRLAAAFRGVSAPSGHYKSGLTSRVVTTQAQRRRRYSSGTWHNVQESSGSDPLQPTPVYITLLNLCNRRHAQQKLPLTSLREQVSHNSYRGVGQCCRLHKKI